MTDSTRNNTAAADHTLAEPVPTITDDMLVIVPVRNLVLFPGTVVPVAINRDRSLAAAQEAVRNNRKIGFLLQHDPDLQAPTGGDLYGTGTVANIVRYVTGADGTHHLVVQGERRFRVLDWQNGLPYMVARVEYISDPAHIGSDVEARALNLKRLAALLRQFLFSLIHRIASQGGLEARQRRTQRFLANSTEAPSPRRIAA